MELQKYEALEEQSISSSEITIKIKLNSEERFVIIDEDSGSVEDIIAQAFPTELEEGKNVRLVYNGKPMDRSDLISSFGLVEGAVVHAAINDPKLMEK
jgi:hypothetical protein